MLVCAFEGNANAAYFDDISLLREAAQTMRYDDDGNLVSVESPGLEEDTNTYSGGNLIQTVTGGNGTYEYTYDTTYKHRLKSVTNDLITQSMGYDASGNVTSTTLSGSGGKTISTSAAYGGSQNRLTSITDATGATVTYGYSNVDSQMMALPTSITDPNGTVTTSSYDSNYRVTQTGIANVAGLVYNYSSGNLSSVKRTNNASSEQTYSFTYDAFGNMTALKVGTQTLATYTYGAGNGLLMSQTYANGDSVSFTYDNLGRTKTATYSDGRVLTYVYNGEGNLHSVTETNGSATVTYLYTYDSIGRLISSEQKNGSTTTLRTHQTYNEYNQLKKQGWQMGSAGYSEEYTYNSADGSLATMKTGVGNTLTMGYDGLRRLSTVSGGPFNRTYTYRDISSSKTTMQVSGLSYSLGSGMNFGYTYDDLGNIETYTAPDGGVITYTYDAQGQLLQAAGDTTYNYTYDTVGNILTANGHSYTYGNSNWKDLLTAYDGETITYDNSGNPISYYNGTRWALTWDNGRSLTRAVSTSTAVDFTYDLSGLRTSKTVGGVEHNYLYAGGKLMRETYGSNTLDFFYDANGTPYALKYNGTVYYYVTNLQGDVVRIVDASGNTVASYEYDPYGKVISATGTLAEVNPIRYRGYYYDNETGLYYLQSRYYDPAIGRFINADVFASTGQGIIGTNMFAYCGNNPSNRTDSSGVFWNDVKNFFKNVANKVVSWAESFFGAEATSTLTTFEQERAIIPDPSPITVKSGTTTTRTVTSYGDASKPLSVNADLSINHPIKSSSVGAAINVSNKSLNVNLAIDDIGIYGSVTNGNRTNNLGVTINLSELKIGIQHSTDVSYGDSTITNYTNYSINGASIIILYYFLTTGNFNTPTPSPVLGNG